jgi:hypothetical protein
VATMRSGDPDAARVAQELYRGQLLPEDLYEDWTEPARGELERLREEVELLAGDGGAPRTEADARRDNLPAELTTFIGREAELGEVARLLRRGPLLTLAGAAGCRKTRLALETAARQRNGESSPAMASASALTPPRSRPGSAPACSHPTRSTTKTNGSTTRPRPTTPGSSADAATASTAKNPSNHPQQVHYETNAFQRGVLGGVVMCRAPSSDSRFWKWWLA